MYRIRQVEAYKYRAAIAEGDAIVSELCSDIEKTQQWCENILGYAMKRIDEDDDIFKKNA